jgi:hypothetical protein
MPPSPQLAPHMMGFLQSLHNQDEGKNWANWLVYYVGKLTSLSEDSSSLAERQMVNVRVQLSYGPFVQVLYAPLFIFIYIYLFLQVMFETSVTVKEIFKTVVMRTHMKNTGMYYLYVVNGANGMRVFT